MKNNNFIEDIFKEEDCVKCKYFLSWYDFMGDGDELEPKDLGKCENELNNSYAGEQLSCGEGDVCDLFEDVK